MFGLWHRSLMPPDRRSSFHPVIMAAADARCSHRRALAGASSFAWQALRWQSGCPHVARRWQWATPRHGTDTPGVIWFSLLLARAMPPLLEWGSWEREEASSGPLRCGVGVGSARFCAPGGQAAVDTCSSGFRPPRPAACSRGGRAHGCHRMPRHRHGSALLPPLPRPRTPQALQGVRP